MSGLARGSSDSEYIDTVTLNTTENTIVPRTETLDLATKMLLPHNP